MAEGFGVECDVVERIEIIEECRRGGTAGERMAVICRWGKFFQIFVGKWPSDLREAEPEVSSKFSWHPLPLPLSLPLSLSLSLSNLHSEEV